MARQKICSPGANLKDRRIFVRTRPSRTIRRSPSVQISQNLSIPGDSARRKWHRRKLDRPAHRRAAIKVKNTLLAGLWLNPRTHCSRVPVRVGNATQGLFDELFPRTDARYRRLGFYSVASLRTASGRRSRGSLRRQLLYRPTPEH